ncbi:hypothetical protein Clacol_006886 [Clathrus columnatus]|uniref:DUF6534 domain-containing protein n=1 Tax=Clathrus columnatus TaxID=1419009 RepID=A0AAV5AIY2_9AGAM|nr:hypothetical protein Clacol_006886 [Clathrus columnatus]
MNVSTSAPSPASDISQTYGAVYIGGKYTQLNWLEEYLKLLNTQFSLLLFFRVGVVWSVDLVHLVFIGRAVYYYLVLNWGNGNVLPFSIWTFDAHLVLLGLATILCQSFFLRRIYIFSGRNLPLLIFLIVMCLSVFALALYASIKDIQVSVVKEFMILKPEVTALFSIGAGSDVIIALLLCYYLRRQNTNSTFSRTHSIIAILIRYTVTTGLATRQAFLLLQKAMHLSLGRMYTNALLATLNSRRTLREMHDPSKGRHSVKPAMSSRHTGTFKGQGVSIQIETVQKTSERDPYSPASYKNSERTSDYDIELGAVENVMTDIVPGPVNLYGYNKQWESELAAGRAEAI